MIVILAAIASSSILGALLAWMQAASGLAIALGYVAGGWAGLLVALAVLMLRPDPDDEAPGRALSDAAPRQGWKTPLPAPIAVLHKATR